MAQRLLAPLHNSFQRHVADSVPVMRAVKQVCVYFYMTSNFIAAMEPRGRLGSCGPCQCVWQTPFFLARRVERTWSIVTLCLLPCAVPASHMQRRYRPISTVASMISMLVGPCMRHSAVLGDWGLGVSFGDFSCIIVRPPPPFLLVPATPAGCTPLYPQGSRWAAMIVISYILLSGDVTSARRLMEAWAVGCVLLV
jgi:hypothetical protein